MEEWRKKLINEGDKNQAFDYIEYLEKKGSDLSDYE